MSALSKRAFMRCLCSGAGLLAAAGVPVRALEQSPRTTLTADQALALLKRGNADFVANTPQPSAQNKERRLEIARGQTPFCVLLGCSDSRVPPEILFGRGLGELFIVRVAGNTVDDVGMGSIEYAVAELGVPLVVVLGHERCGAVAAALDLVEKNTAYPGSIQAMVEPIVPAVLRARGQPGDWLDNSVRENVRLVVERLRTAAEPLLLEPQRAGRLKVVGARYGLDTGEVDFFV